MGQDAVEINGKLLEVIRPIVARLSAIGVLRNRDYRTVWFLPCTIFSCLRDSSTILCPTTFWLVTMITFLKHF